VQAFRGLTDMHRRWWLVLCLAALALRLLIPAGHMPVIDAGGLAIVACPDAAAPMAVPRDRDTPPHHARTHRTGGHDDRHDDGDRGGGQVCAFAGLSAPLLGGADPLLLVAVLAWIAATALAMRPLRIVRRTPHLRPPPQGPPATT
jgi:hypothetical protein